MSLFLIRHAHAVSADENPNRPLSPRGRQQVRRLAAFLAKSGGFGCAELWHSPLARSIETAGRLVQHLGLEARLTLTPGLEGDDPPDRIAARLRSRRAPLALVGHEPHLSALATLLVSGRTEPSGFVLKKCAVLALVRRAGAWSVLWQITPQLYAPDSH